MTLSYEELKEAQQEFMQEMKSEINRLNPKISSLYIQGYDDAMEYALIFLEKLHKLDMEKYTKMMNDEAKEHHEVVSDIEKEGGFVSVGGTWMNRSDTEDKGAGYE